MPSLCLWAPKVPEPDTQCALRHEALHTLAPSRLLPPQLLGTELEKEKERKQETQGLAWAVQTSSSLPHFKGSLGSSFFFLYSFSKVSRPKKKKKKI